MDGYINNGEFIDEYELNVKLMGKEDEEGNALLNKTTKHKCPLIKEEIKDLLSSRGRKILFRVYYYDKERDDVDIIGLTPQCKRGNIGYYDKESNSFIFA